MCRDIEMTLAKLTFDVNEDNLINDFYKDNVQR